MKNYIVNNFKAINYQYAVGQSLPTWGDLEGWSLKTMMFEKYPSISPYTYCANNPVMFVYPTGMFDEDPSVHIDKFGNVIAQYDDNDNTVYLHATGNTEQQIDQQRAAKNNDEKKSSEAQKGMEQLKTLTRPYGDRPINNYWIRMGMLKSSSIR
jgi:hypothetical protein